MLGWPISELTISPSRASGLRVNSNFSSGEVPSEPIHTVFAFTTSKTGKHGSAKMALEYGDYFLPWLPTKEKVAPVTEAIKLVTVERLEGKVDEVLEFAEGLKEYILFREQYGLQQRVNTTLLERVKDKGCFILVREDPDVVSAPDPSKYVVIPCHEVRPAIQAPVRFCFLPQYGSRLVAVGNVKAKL